jgi:type IV pilus assembly protein PilW
MKRANPLKLRREHGFSLIELMAAITAIVVLNVLTSYQARSNTTSGRNDAEIGASVSMYALEKDIRMSGAGLTTPQGLFCPQGVNIAWAGAVVSDGAALLPVRIIDGGAGPDMIEIVRSDSDFGAAPSRLVGSMTAPTSQLSVDGDLGLRLGDLVMVGASDGTKICTLMQMTSAPTANGSGWLLTHAAGVGNYNPANPDALFTNSVAYLVRDRVMNMGTFGVRRYGIVCNAGTTPIATNNCDLAWWNPLSGAAPTIATVTSVSPQIVDLQAQYGIAPAGSDVINQWVDATAASGWSNPSLANQGRIKALRLAIVARGTREGGTVAPASVKLWDDDNGDGTNDDPRNHNFSTADRRFRYQVLTVVVPLINSIWAK